MKHSANPQEETLRSYIFHTENRELGWNDAIENESTFEVLLEGDYAFTVTRFERGRHQGSDTKNYFAHGGNELVVGGKLTFLPGATVEGAEGLFDLPSGGNGACLPFLADNNSLSFRNSTNDFT